MPNISPIALRWEALNETLNERQRRLLLGAEARVLGRGGIAEVAAATGASRTTIAAGIKELDSSRSIDASDESRSTTATGSRRPGGGRKRLETTDETLVADLLALVEPTTRGDPESPLRWTCKSLRNLADELKARHHQVSHVVVGNLLRSQNFSLQANAKVLEGNQSPDRNAQFEYINAVVKTALDANEPVISVDTKKKELVGAFKNAGQRWLPRGQPDQVQVHDFVDKDLGRANPYGVYDIGADEGWVSVGTDHDTSAFAVQTIRRWWLSMGRERYPEARRLTITADGGGSNGHRIRLWKYELSQLARELGLEIHVHHFPPGTSKWNKIEHRLFSFITMNWRARPLISHEVIVNLIANTRTRSGLLVKAELDTAAYPKGISVTDAQMATIKIDRSDFHGEWNYCIRP